MKNPFVFRPFSIIGILVALHSIMVGIGFLGIDSVPKTPLYTAVKDLLPTATFGGLLIGIGVVVCLSYLSGSIGLVNFTSSIQTLFWIFITIAYCISGDTFLAFQNALFWVFLSSYTALAFGNKNFWLDRR